MRKKKYFCILLVAAQVWMFAACSNDFDWQLQRHEIPKGTIRVGEARAFFETQIMQSGITLDNTELQGFATNFTPQWEHAVISGQDYMAAVDVPIITDLTFTVWGVDQTLKTDSFEIDLLQKLIVVKDLRTDNMGTYVVTIIPDKYYALSKEKMSAMDFPNYGDYGNFSGRIIYSLPLSTVPMRVDLYRNGILIDAGAFFGIWDNPSELQIASDKMKELMGGFNLIRKFRLNFRSYNEMDGGSLPEVVITPNNNGGGGYWDDYWNNYWNNLINTPPSSPDPQPNGGGSGNNGGPSAAASSIMRNINLNTSGINKLNETLEKILKLCGYSYVKTFLNTNAFYFSSVKYNTNMNSIGGYNPSNRELTFKSEDNIEDDFPEEFLHLYQDAYYQYKGGIGKYLNAAGMPNIEFEAKVMMDVICVLAAGACPYMGATPDNWTYYSNWIEHITDGNSRVPNLVDLLCVYPDCNNKNYWNFLSDFSNDSIRFQYNGQINRDLYPEALMNLSDAKCF